jgi:hypothetical protein
MTEEQQNLLAATRMDEHTCAELIERLRELEEIGVDDDGEVRWMGNGERVGA